MSMNKNVNINDMNTTTVDHHNSNYNNYNYNNRYTDPGVRVEKTLSPEEGEAIVEAYKLNISEYGMTAAVAQEIEQAYAKGLTAEEIILAIEETGFAPRPSPAYLRAILRNWAFSGVTVTKNPVGGSNIKTNNAQPWWKVNCTLRR